MNKIINQELSHESGDSWTFTLTGKTGYSEAVDVGQIDATKTVIFTESLMSNATQGTVTATVQTYVLGVGWVDTGTAWTVSVHSGQATQSAYTVMTNACFGTRIRVKLVSSGTTWHVDEQHILTVFIVGKQ